MPSRADVGVRPYANYEAICKIRSCQQRRARVSPPYAEGLVFAPNPKSCVGRGALTPPRIPHRLSCNAVRALIERPPPAPQRIIPIRAVGTPHFLLFHYYLLLSTASGGGGIVFLAMCTKFWGQILRCGGEKNVRNLLTRIPVYRYTDGVDREGSWLFCCVPP